MSILLFIYINKGQEQTAKGFFLKTIVKMSSFLTNFVP